MSQIMELEANQCVVDVLLARCLEHPCYHCGKCTFGYEEVTQLQMILKDMTMKKGQPQDIDLMKDLAGLMATESLCEDGIHLVQDVLDVLERYKDDLMQHAARKSCPANVCCAFMTFHVLASKCAGCNECMDICEDEAILGKKGDIHVIDLELCSQCGKCVDICERSAIVAAGLQKPKGPKQPVPVK